MNPVVTTERKSCAVCDSKRLEVAIELPELPLTGIYSTEAVKNPVNGIDQQLLFCTCCGHTQLARQVDPNIIYGKSYNFRTSTSIMAQDEASFFLSRLEEIAPRKYFNSVLDIGCNDLYLLKRMSEQAKIRVGIDPIWNGEEEQRKDKSITVFGNAIEDIKLESVLETTPDLIVCRHTLEHIYNPREVLKQLFRIADENTLFLFEVPGFEPMINKLRFDQIFHQHLQYFSLASFQRLIDEVGGAYVSHWENYHKWGALIIAFTKQGNHQKQYKKVISPKFSNSEIHKRYVVFRQQMSTVNDILKSFEGTRLYGYGATEMLPILAYHLGNNLKLLTAVLDDDLSKDGLHYWNLPLTIYYPEKVSDLKTASVFITAVDNTEQILRKLLELRPQHIIHPFHII